MIGELNGFAIFMVFFLYFLKELFEFRNELLSLAVGENLVFVFEGVYF